MSALASMVDLSAALAAHQRLKAAPTRMSPMRADAIRVGVEKAAKARAGKRYGPGRTVRGSLTSKLIRALQEHGPLTVQQLSQLTGIPTRLIGCRLKCHVDGGRATFTPAKYEWNGK